MENRIHEILGVLGTDREEGTKVNAYYKELLQKFLGIFNLNEVGENN